jgi:hypothetical protein
MTVPVFGVVRATALLFDDERIIDEITDDGRSMGWVQ